MHFNVARSLAIFYGANRQDYYLTEGLPLLLTTALPFTAIGFWRIFRHTKDLPADSGPGFTQAKVLKILAFTTFVVTFALSLISHKEVRFIYPLLPILHIIAARPLSSFVFDPPSAGTRKHVLATLITINIIIAVYTTQYHQRGVIDVMHYLRHEHEARLKDIGVDARTSVAFLMPCHSTPWRSHLVHEGIDAWALTCEPPLDVPLEKRGEYMDEADQFYEDPVAWMKGNMGGATGNKAENAVRGERPWPQYVVFFEQLESTMVSVLEGGPWAECWRGFNSHWHDDWRRKGDVIVWCRSDSEKQVE